MRTVRNPHIALHDLDLLLADYLVKKVAWETMVPPDQDLETNCREYREAEEAVDRLISFPCSTLAEVRKKARILAFFLTSARVDLLPLLNPCGG